MDIVNQRIRELNPWWVSDFRYMRSTPRNILKKIIDLKNTNHIKDIMGIRRCGKTVLMMQIIENLISENVSGKEILFLNFDDPVINATPIEEIISKAYEISPNYEYLFIDEVQEKKEWERWIRNLYDQKKFKQIYISGSNSTLLRGDISRVLTGRHLSFILAPFSFDEFLIHNGWTNFEKDYCFREKDKMSHFLMEYLVKGGFPETCQKDDFTLREILSSLFNDILARDIAMHFSIESEKLKKVAQYLISNVSQEYSYRKVSTNIQIHADTVEKYIDYLENSFMISSLPMFSYKIKTQFRMQKKIYCVDNGLRNTVAFRTGKELGILAENLVYNELKIRGHELYYWKSMDHEIDFIISNGAEVLHLIQVAWELNDEGTIKREINGIIAAARSFNKNEGIILNKNEYKEETISNIKIKFIPIGFWLMKLIDF